jgi:hypothetical protein
MQCLQQTKSNQTEPSARFDLHQESPGLILFIVVWFDGLPNRPGLRQSLPIKLLSRSSSTRARTILLTQALSRRLGARFVNYSTQVACFEVFWCLYEYHNTQRGSFGAFWCFFECYWYPAQSPRLHMPVWTGLVWSGLV